MTRFMDSTTLTWEGTLSALLPLVGRTVYSTALVGGAPLLGFAAAILAVDVQPAHYTGVEEAASISLKARG